MARITQNDFTEKNGERVRVQEPVEATFCTFTDGGQKYFQITTYGSEHREVPGKASQTIQFDRDMALELIKKLQAEFK